MFDSLGTSRPLLIDLTWKYSSKIVFSEPICTGKVLGVLLFRYENSLVLGQVAQIKEGTARWK